MTHAIRLTVLVCFCSWLVAPASAQSCGPVNGLEFVCGPKNAEDLVRVPGTPWIIASGMTAGASLTLIDSRDGTYSGLHAQAKHDATFANCATPPDSAKAITHGLNLRAGANGRSTLYAVGHGAREAIEVFDVDATGAKPALTWKGCVPMPEGLAANSVASFADGSLVATVLVMPGKTFADSVMKRPTGAVYEWSPGKKGFELIRGSELPGNNGIEVSADGKEIFVVSSGFQTVVAFAHANPTKQLRTTRPLPIHTRQRAHGRGRAPAHGRHEERRAGVRWHAGSGAFAREAVDLPARLHGARDRSEDDEGHAGGGEPHDPDFQQRDDGARVR